MTCLNYTDLCAPPLDLKNSWRNSVASSLTVRSSLPGRIRFDVPLLRRLPHISSGLEADLAAAAGVLQVHANGLTGGVLVKYAAEISATDIEVHLRQSLLRRVENVVSTASQQNASASGAPPLMRLLATTEPHRALRRRAFALSLANGLEDATPPLLLGLAVDTVSRGTGSILGSFGLKTLGSRLVGLGALSVGFWMLSALIEYFTDRARADLANAVRHDLRVALYNRIQTLDVGQVESKEVSDWTAVIDADVNQVHGFIRQGLTPFFSTASNLVIVAGTFLVVSPSFALVQLLMLPPLIFASRSLLKPIRMGYMKARDDGERMGALLSGNLQGISTIASFNAQEVEAQRVQEYSQRFTQSIRNAERLEAIYVPSLRAIAGGGFIASIVWGGVKVSGGTLSMGALNTMALTQLRLLSAIARLGYGLDQYQRTATALERIYRTLDARATIIGGQHTLPKSDVRGDIVFDNVTFGYDPLHPVLKSISLRCPAGKTIGIVGATGAGKSTVMKLMLRFHDPQGGRLLLDGENVSNLPLGDLRESISLVSQQVTLFAGSVHENIAYGRRTATRSEVIAAAKVAEAHDFIMQLPEQYDTQLGSGGLSLSGGQRQRIAIARAILADRPILLFDEATSALDFETEAALQRSLEAFVINRSTVVVAHRLSTVRHADMIYFLSNGEVSECGTHDELLAAQGAYAGMWMIQTGEKSQGLKKSQNSKVAKRLPIASST
jgi:ATP-binding cassette subfamily B protein